MGAVLTRRVETNEEMKLRSAETLVDLVQLLNALRDDPDLIKKLGKDAADSWTLADDAAARHQKALLDIETADKVRKELTDVDKKLEQQKVDITEQQKVALEVVNRARIEHEKDVRDQQEKFDAAVVRLAEREEEIKRAVSKLNYDQDAVGRANAALEQKNTELVAAHAAKTKTLLNEHAAKQALLDKREKEIDAKLKKIEETRRALAEG